MLRKIILWFSLFFFALALVAFGAHPLLRQTSRPGLAMMGGNMMDNGMMGDCMMDGGMMDGGMMDGGMMGGGMMEDMQVVRQLFAHHDQIRRSTEEIPGGVQTLTESDNPDVTALIQRHVASMHQRLAEGRWFAMMSQTLPILFQNADRYQRQSQATPNGVRVVKTSEDPDLAIVLRDHAQEVTQFVQEGMPCGGRGRMGR